MTQIYFVRHALPNFDNHNDLARELTQIGLQDTMLVVDYFKGKKIDAILSSPYKRAFDTVAPLAEERSMTIIPIDDFRERKVDSIWIEDFDEFADRQWADFNYKLKDGETLGEVQERNIAALRTVLDAYSDRMVVIGGHGTAISTVINYFLPEFGRDDYLRIQPKMPWVVRLDFEGDVCKQIEEFDLFAGERILHSLSGGN